MIDDTRERRVAQGHTARFYAKHEARRTAEGAAKILSAPVGVWLDSLGFIVTTMADPVTREDASLVLVMQP